jgi:hypothetical protein
LKTIAYYNTLLGDKATNKKKQSEKKKEK